jgi:hypothetical protein
MNIGADSFGLSLTWMSISFLFVNMEVNFFSEQGAQTEGLARAIQYP